MSASSPEMKVTAMAPTFRAINGSAQSIDLADGSIQCSITSPPYWGMRSYSTNPQVWGGDAQCAHEWAAAGTRHKGGPQGPTGERSSRDTTAQTEAQHLPTGDFCTRCDAWRGEYGSEPTPELYVAHTVQIFREVRRVLRDDGTVWLNLGDCYATGAGSAKNPGGGVKSRSALQGKHAKHLTLETYPACQVNRMPIHGLKPKDQVFIPHRVAMALQADGWWIRDTIIWAKPNPMPSSVTDRTTTAHEYVFLLTKSARYFYDADAIREPVTSTGGASFGKQNHDAGGTGQQSRKLADPAERNHPLGRNKRSVWTIPTQSFHGAHFATFPTRLVEPMILAGTSERGCCPTCGAGWKRVTERIDSGERQKMPAGFATHEGDHGSIHRERREKGKTGVPVMLNITTHWVPSCKCPAHQPIPCTVLDPFAGAFTTGVVAKRLGRSFVGVELNPEYIAMGVKRVEEDAPKVKRRSRPRAVKGEATLFAEVA